MTFGTNWVADPEAGGYYQALVDGTYAKYGLDVTILPGGPTANNGMLLIAGKIEFVMGGDMIGDFLSVQNNIPIIAVAADFQKNPQVFMSHPGVGLDKWEDLPKADPRSSAAARSTRSGRGCVWLTASRTRTSSRTISIRRRSSSTRIRSSRAISPPSRSRSRSRAISSPTSSCSPITATPPIRPSIDTRRDIVEKHPDIVQRFVDASAIGWYHYLYGDNAKANEAIKKENPEITDDEIAFSIAKMKEYGIVDSGDTLKMGIGAMTDAHWKDFFDKMVKAGIVKPDIDYKKAYTLQFVNKGVGLDLRPK